jgi:hypothetical protein
MYEDVAQVHMFPVAAAQAASGSATFVPAHRVYPRRGLRRCYRVVNWLEGDGSAAGEGMGQGAAVDQLQLATQGHTVGDA